tara:strand:+ start:69 stop:320 length:252 start_codon:yes stop_codon:yes gene_type:complete
LIIFNLIKDKKMTENKTENNNPVLTFEGKKYNVNDLTNETKEIIKGLQIAETQLKMYEDTFKLLSIGRNSLTNQLREKLKNYE